MRTDDWEQAIALGDLDLWTVDASAGDRISVQVAELTGGAGFAPQLEIMSPDGSRLGFVSGLVTARADLQAREAGTYSVLVSDANQTGTGTYRLRLAQVPGSFVVPMGDDRGALMDAVNHDGTVAVGDVDMWTFFATAGESIVVRAGETATGPLLPWLRLYGPDGALLDSSSGTVAAEVVSRATTSGVFRVTVADGSSGGLQTGSYRLSLAVMPEQFSTSASDDGGPVPADSGIPGEITTGDIDIWSFEANQGNSLVIRMVELVGPGLSPWLRVYGTDGRLIGQNFSTTAAQVSFVAPQSGLYTVVASDGNSGFGGTGTYELTVTGLPVQGKKLRYEQPTTDSLLINWPSELTGYVLQQNPVLSPTGWEDVERVPDDNGFNVRLTVPIEPTGNRFFRLRLP